MTIRLRRQDSDDRMIAALDGIRKELDGISWIMFFGLVVFVFRTCAGR